MSTKYKVEEGKLVKVEESTDLVSYEISPVGKATAGVQRVVIRKMGKVIFDGSISDSMPNDVKVIDDAIEALVKKLKKSK